MSVAKVKLGRSFGLRVKSEDHMNALETETTKLGRGKAKTPGPMNLKATQNAQDRQPKDKYTFLSAVNGTLMAFFCL